MRSKEKADNHHTGFTKNELRLMEKMFENAPLAICLLEGPEHRLRYMNKRFRRLYGDASYQPGTPARDILGGFKDPDEAMQRMNLLDRVYQSGKAFIVNEFKTSLDIEGTGEPQEAYVNLICQPIEDEAGEVYGLFIAGYNVTGQVKARQAIARNEERLQVALQGARVGFWEVEAQSNTFSYLSKEFKAHFGRSPDEPFTYEDFINSIHPDDLPAVMEELQEAVEEQRFYEVEYRAIRSDKSERWILVRGQVIYDENDRPQRRLGISMDITKQKQTEQRLKEAVRLRDDFLAIASHELNTPVTSLKTRADLFERQLRDLGSEDGAEKVGKLHRHIDQLAKLTDNLLDISRIQAGRMSLERSTFSLDELITETLESLQQLSHHTLQVEVAPSLQVYADRFRIGQVLTNLIENAVKYSPQADRVVVRYGRHGDKTVVSVADFGIGVPKEDQQRVFERFHKGSGAQKNTYPGFGIGLYVARQIVEEHGGGIWVEDNPQGGSVFSFSLPVSTQ